MDLLGRSQPLRCAPSFDSLCVIDSYIFFSPVCKAGSTLFLVAAGERISTELLSCEPVTVWGWACVTVLRAISGALSQRILSGRAADGLLCASQSTSCLSTDALIARKHP